MTLELEIELRDVLESDLALIRDMRADTGLQHCLLAHPQDRGPNDAEEWIARRKREGKLWIIAHRGGSRGVGFIQLNRQHFLDRYAYFGIAMASQEKGKGYGFAAIRILFRTVDVELNLNKLLLEVRADNSAALSLYDRLGFRTAGLFEQHYFDGMQWHDVVAMERRLPADHPS